MTAYNKVNGVHAPENFKLLQDVLKKEWGYSGMVTSDWEEPAKPTPSFYQS
jgi:beta-glucosidase